jgi:hypothetical protein
MASNVEPVWFMIVFRCQGIGRANPGMSGSKKPAWELREMERSDRVSPARVYQCNLCLDIVNIKINITRYSKAFRLEF